MAARSVKVPGPRLPWELPIAKLDPADVYAVQAFASGKANEAQQLRAWRFIREQLCRGEEMVFWPGGEDGRRATDFHAGLQFVAAFLRRVSRLKPVDVDSRGEPPPMPSSNAEDK